MEKRDIRIDNIKGLLILLTVFGHMLEMTAFADVSYLYKLIYSFHMPAFLFVSGYLARFSLMKLLKCTLPLYLIAQFVYILFDMIFIGSRSVSFSEFFTPYWHLWYIFAFIFYILLVPLLDRIRGHKRIAAMILCFISSLLFPYLRFNMYFMSVGRFFSFLPFFVGGYFFGHGEARMPKANLLISASLFFISISDKITAKALYGSFSYLDSGSDIFTRALLILFAFGWIFFLFRIVPQTKTMLAYLGRNSLSIYLLHGFFLRALNIFSIRVRSSFAALVISAVLCFALADIGIPKVLKSCLPLKRKINGIAK